MKQILLVLSCFIFLFPDSFAQVSYNKADSLFVFHGCCTPKPEIKMRDTIKIKMCRQATGLNDQPLYIIDGVIAEESEVKNIDPNNIDRIDILKDASVGFYFGHGKQGVVLITTKNKRTIKIRDAESGEPIPAATVDLIYGKRKQHTLRLQTDSLGEVKPDKTIADDQFELKVTSTGYKTYNTSINAETIKAGYTVSVQRNYTDLKEVVVRNLGGCTLRKIYYSGTESFSCKLPGIIGRSDYDKRALNLGEKKEIRFYPNPVLRSQKVNIEFENVKTEKIILKLFSLDGKSVEIKEYESIKGLNKISYSINPRLASGSYAIQLIDENNELIKTEKLIIQ